jgi:hypothetical protein
MRDRSCSGSFVSKRPGNKYKKYDDQQLGAAVLQVLQLQLEGCQQAVAAVHNEQPNIPKSTLERHVKRAAAQGKENVNPDQQLHQPRGPGHRPCAAQQLLAAGRQAFQDLVGAPNQQQQA